MFKSAIFKSAIFKSAIFRSAFLKSALFKSFVFKTDIVKSAVLISAIWKSTIHKNQLCIYVRYQTIKNYKFIKGTVSVISSDPPCKDDNVRFTTEPLKALSDQV